MSKLREQVAILAWNRATPANCRKAQRAIDAVGGESAFCRVISDPTLAVDGVSDAGMRRLRAAYELGVMATSVVREQGTVITSSGDVAGLVGPRLRPLTYEEVWLIGVDARNCVVGLQMVSRGGRHGAALTAKDLLRVAIRLGCHAFVLVHNHPGGDPRPSAEDVALTRTVMTASEAVGVTLLDHVVVTRTGHSSMLNLGLIDAGTNLIAAEGSR